MPARRTSGRASRSPAEARADTWSSAKSPTPTAARGEPAEFITWPGACPIDETELKVRERIERARRRPTEVIDRFWFKSVYFLEPGGVLFELATDGPGFTVDEDPKSLGEHLVLPPWLESQRKEIESQLPPLHPPVSHSINGNGNRKPDTGYGYRAVQGAAATSTASSLSAACCRSTRFSTFPTWVFGSSVTNSYFDGTLYGASLSRQNVFSSAPVAV